MWLSRAPRTGKRCAAPLAAGGRGQGSRQGRRRALGISLGRRLGTRAKAPGPRAPIQEETPLLSEMPDPPLEQKQGRRMCPKNKETLMKPGPCRLVGNRSVRGACPGQLHVEGICWLG